MNSQDITLDDVFSGKATSRYLSLSEDLIQPIKNRGGNTLVFNRDLLQIPNWTVSIGGKQGRRSDFFWALLAEQNGYRIVNVPYSTLHNRKKLSFSYEDEERKFLSDLIGSSFTKAIDETGVEGTNKSIHASYSSHFRHRLVKHIANYYRIIGLLKILNGEASEYKDSFSISSLHAFVKNCEYYLDFHRTKAALETLRKRLDIYHHYLDRSVYENKIQSIFALDSLQYLGSGKEGMVFCNSKNVYKYFFKKPENIEYLKYISSQFIKCRHFYKIDILDYEDTIIIKYPFEKSQKYSGGCADQIAELIRFAKNNGFVIRNFTNDNFVVVNGIIKFIDYGHSFDPFDENLYIQSIQRAYQVIRYPFLDEAEFKELVALSYSNRTHEIDSGVSFFRHMVESRSKESLHDEAIIQIIKKHLPKKILDFGAGKCKIVNSLVTTTNVSVFDIDQTTIHQRAEERIKVIENTSEIQDSSFDMVLCNLVLCSVNQTENLKIMDQIARATKKDGIAVFSICNPFFADIENTEIRSVSSPVRYNTANTYEKAIRSTTNLRTEFHRPIEYYRNLFQRFGFRIIAIHETDGVDFEKVLPVSEHLIFECQMIEKDCELSNTSLLIKSNPMEHRTIYDNIRHIISQLEKGIRFTERIVVLDTSSPNERNRRYDQDNLNKTLDEIKRAKENGLINRIVLPIDDETNGIYKQFFIEICTNPYSKNGQALFATLAGFESIKTDYVFQTDSDILYYNNTSGDEIRDAIRYLDDGAITVSPSISRDKIQDPLFGNRTEVRTCLLNLRTLCSILPLPNEVQDGMYSLPWHRSLDIVLSDKQSVRMVSSKFYFIHPENESKTIPNMVKYARNHIEIEPSITPQMNEVNLYSLPNLWVKKATATMALYIRGYNTSCSKIKRLLDSIRNQDYEDFEIVYIDDASTNQSGEYAKAILKNDPYFKSKSIYIENDTRQHILANLVFAMQNIIVDKKTIVVHIDNDDYLLTNHALSRIMDEYKQNAQLTVGNCVRYNKPLKHYKVYSFENVWERGGDNVWLHPKTHLRSLFDYVNIEEDLKIEGKYIDVNTDFAFMLPMIEKSAKSVFIPDLLYYFEPSHENITQENQYEKKHKDEIKALILKKARERHEKGRSSNR
jgi:glycosyltransferase involved in cell wall biosynthesis/SAM-dependent methyltransferase